MYWDDVGMCRDDVRMCRDDVRGCAGCVGDSPRKSKVTTTEREEVPLRVPA